MGDYGPEFRILLYRAWRRLRDFGPVTVPPVAWPSQHRHLAERTLTSGSAIRMRLVPSGRVARRDGKRSTNFHSIQRSLQNRNVGPSARLRFLQLADRRHSTSVLAYVQHVGGVTAFSYTAQRLRQARADQRQRDNGVAGDLQAKVNQRVQHGN